MVSESLEPSSAESGSPRPLSARALRTRQSILEAAETVFAERGFAAARLEDVAERVGIRRASIVYYYRDKGELYEAVLASVFGSLLEQIEPVLRAAQPLAERTEKAVSAWIDFLVERPTAARLLLREVADARPGQPPRLGPYTEPFFATIRDVLESVAPGDSLADGAPIEPAHLASMIAGSTIFFVAAMPLLLPGFSPLENKQLDAHRREVLGVTRRLLGLSEAGST